MKCPAIAFSSWWTRFGVLRHSPSGRGFRQFFGLGPGTNHWLVFLVIVFAHCSKGSVMLSERITLRLFDR